MAMKPSVFGTTNACRRSELALKGFKSWAKALRIAFSTGSMDNWCQNASSKALS